MVVVVVVILGLRITVPQHGPSASTYTNYRKDPK